ncbi:MAG: ferritin family protein [Candidatus Thorarchaeota archaeon]|nr:ferritin family protein [Candidatus Thorarchaeota archaeon]
MVTEGTIMNNVQNAFEQLITLAIEREVEAYEFYTNAAQDAELKSSAKLLHELAKQEESHKQKLEAALKDGVSSTFEVSIDELEMKKLRDYLADVPLNTDSSPQDVLVVAIKREDNAHEFYRILSEMTSHSGHKAVFEMLAREELSHKDRLEKLYDALVQPDM